MKRVLVLLALASAACGEDEKQIIPEPTLENPEQYWNLAVCTCFEYEREDGGPGLLGIGVETNDRLPEGHRFLVYRVGGLAFRTDQVSFSGNDLLLHAVNKGAGASENRWEQFDPPLPLLRYPVKDFGAESQFIEQTSSVFHRDPRIPANETIDVAFRADYQPEADATFSRDGMSTVTEKANQVVYSGTPWGDSRRAFVENTGWVRVRIDRELEPLEGEDTEGPLPSWELVRIEQLTDCRICGTSN